jgi:adenylate kinase family enzyme
LAERLSAQHFDTDDYFWELTEPPYQKQRDEPERLRILIDDLKRAHLWTLSGSVMSWDDSLIPRFDLVIFLYVPTEIRLARLVRRERQRFGAAIEPGGSFCTEHRDFMAWAATYDAGAQPGRSFERHRVWLNALPCPVLPLDGVLAPELLVERAMKSLRF